MSLTDAQLSQGEITMVTKALARDYEAITPDAHVIATSLVASKKKLLKHSGRQQHARKIPKETELAFGINAIAPDFTMNGGSTLVITFQDPDWAMLDSGFFDADEDGRLDNMDLNYPEGSRYWWRLHQVSAQADRSLQMTFLPRIVCELMDVKGPVKVNRAKRTRAEFLKSLCGKVNDDYGPIEFYSKQLDVKQPVGSGTAASTTGTGSSSKAPAKKGAKSVGIGANRGTLTCKGRKLTAHQSEICNAILQVGDQLHAPKNALIGAFYAAMGESSLSDTVSGGVFQTTGDPGKYNGGSDYTAQAHDFFTGTAPFGGVGAIAAANRGDPPWMIANETEVNAVWIASKGDSYGHEWAGGQAEGLREAAAIVEGGGGGGGGSLTIEVAQPYYFRVGAGEDYWAAMNRLAQEVGWELFVDGNRIYYDSDLTLIRQKVAAVIDRDDAEILQWSYDWVNRHQATNFSMNAMCSMFEFHAGEVIQLTGFGPASTGSTAKLPGRWLINEIARSAGDQFSTFTLVQPTAPKMEPAPTMASKTLAGSSGAPIGKVGDETPRSARAVYAAAKWLNDRHLTYTQGSRILTKNVPQGATLYDCSASTAWVMLAAGFAIPSGLTWGNWAPVSGEFIPGQAGLVAGPGKELTIYANGEHVFFHCHPNGLPDMQGNTVNAGHGHGFCFFPWNSPGTGGWGGPSPGGGGAPAFIATHYPGT